MTTAFAPATSPLTIHARPVRRGPLRRTAAVVWRGRAWIVLAALLVAGAVAVNADPDLVATTGEALRGADLRWVAAAIVAATASIAAASLLQRRVLLAGGVRIDRRAMLGVTYASNAVSVTLPIAGSAAGAAYSYRQLTRRGADGALIAWALAIAGIVSTATLAVLVAAGSGARGGAGTAALGALAVLVGITPLVVVLAAPRSPRVFELVVRAATRVLTAGRRLVGRDADASVEAGVRDALHRFTSYRLGGRATSSTIGYAVVNWTMDAASLAACLAAVGAPVPWEHLALAYAAGLGTATLSLSPAGIGIVEATIAVTLVNAGLPARVALPAAVAYRAISCWLALVAGWVVFALARRRDGAEVAPVRDAGRPQACTRRPSDPAALPHPLVMTETGSSWSGCARRSAHCRSTAVRVPMPRRTFVPPNRNQD